MGRKRKEQPPLEPHFKAIVDYYLQMIQHGEKVTILSLLEELLNAFMIAERNFYLSLDTDNQANGFYNRTLKLTMGT